MRSSHVVGIFPHRVSTRHSGGKKNQSSQEYQKPRAFVSDGDRVRFRLALALGKAAAVLALLVRVLFRRVGRHQREPVVCARAPKGVGERGRRLRRFPTRGPPTPVIVVVF